MCTNTDINPRRAKESTRPPRHTMKKEQRQISARQLNTTIDTRDGSDTANFLMSKRQRTTALRQPQINKSVSFDESVMVRPHIPLSDYTDREIIACWFLPIEKQNIRFEIMNIIKVVKEKNAKSDKKYNVRGLEWMSETDKTREKKRKQSVKDILHEQKSQRAKAQLEQDNNINDNDDDELKPMGIVFDTHRFRKVYRRYSKSALHHAQTMGHIDAMEAGIVCKAPRRSSTSMISHNDSFNSVGSAGNHSSRSTRSSTSNHSMRSTHSKTTASRRTRRGSRRSSIALGEKENAANQQVIINGLLAVL